MGKIVLIFSFLLIVPAAFSSTYEMQLIVSKYVFGPAENLSITGYISNITSNSTANLTTYVSGSNVSLFMLNSSNVSVASYTFLTNENGTFSTQSLFNPAAQIVLTPSTVGTYILLANTSIDNATWKSSANIVVVAARIDDIVFQLPKVNFYASENMPITAKAIQKVGDKSIGVSNITLNITMRFANETKISSFTCVTSAAGTCTVNTTAPSAAGTYFLESNNFVGFTNFNVVPFDIEAYMKDSSSLVFKNVFSKGETGFVEVRVSFNSTAPDGSYNATGDIIDSSGAVVLSLSSVLLNSSNGFVDKISFTAVSSMRVGFYTTRVAVAKAGGDSVNTTTSFQVRDWAMSFTKTAQNSGFEYGYTSFPNTIVYFEAYPVERANGTVIQNATGNFTISLKNSLGATIANATARYNTSCGSKACYEFNLTLPGGAGDYTLTVVLNLTDDYQASDRTIKVTDITVSVQPSDSEGTLKEYFGTTEFVYISLTGKNTTSAMNISNAEVTSVIYENGTKLSYSEANLSAMNLSDSTLKWAWNSSVRRLMIDPPKVGGIYLIEVYVNNKSAAVTTTVGINPYDICTSAKASADTSQSDYWFQFRTSDTIYFQIKLNEAQNTVGKKLSSNLSGFSSSYGRTSACNFDSTTKRSVNNATITIEKVLNTQSGKYETLNASSSTCSGVDNSGGYTCTVQPLDGAWDGGRHVVTFSALGDDRATSQRGTGFFEARAFYIYGYSSNWASKSNSSITLNVNAYEAGSGWWTSSNGLAGTAVVDSLNYYGGGSGEWIWPPIKADYNVTNLNLTLTNGVGTVTLSPSRAPGGVWASGYYSAVIKATVNSQVDYGEAWFSIRSWDAYASPVEIVSNRFETKNSINAKENVSLYVKLGEAGDYSDFSGGRALGNVTLKVKKIIDYSQSPPAELTASNFSSTSVTVNASSPWYSNANTTTFGKFIINITPASRTWGTGYYSVIIDINGTETGYGWFNVISFSINSQPTNANGSGYVYNNKGSGPVYFNLTTTKAQKNSYLSTDYVNATITEAVLRLWDSVTYQQKELRYPTDFNITPLLVNGSGIINVSRFSGSWPSGYYNGEVKMRNVADNATSKGYIWFSVQPFRVSASTSSYNVGTRDNVTVSMTVFEPDWYNSAVINGNYTVSAVQDTSWTGGSYRITNLNFTINNVSSGVTFRNSTTLVINPAGGKWKPGYKSGTIVVRDNLTNDTQTAWFSFRATSFIDSVNRISAYNAGTGENITVNITLTTPSGARSSGNLSSVFYWGWPSKTNYRFVAGNCDSSASANCFINSSAIVTIVPPSGGWPEGYNYLYFTYVEPDDRTQVIESYNSVYFYARQSITGYMYAVDDNAGYKSKFGQRDNVTMYAYSISNISGSAISVNVTNVQVAKTSSGCWSDSCRNYVDAAFEIMNFTNNRLVSAGRRNMSGYVRINASGGSWDLGEYAVKLFVTNQANGETGTIKDATFRISDNTPAGITITAPAMGQAINSSNITFTLTTTEQANCYINVYDYGQFDRAYCSGNSTAPAACNATRYNKDNNTSNYYSYASKWYGSYGNVVSTDSTSHSYKHLTTGMPVPQNYTVKVDCYDNDYNYATNYTTFNLIDRGSLSVNTTSLGIAVSAPANATLSLPSFTTALNFSVINGTASQCWYSLNGGSNNTLSSCANTSFAPVMGSNRLVVFANASNGAIAHATREFTMHIFGSQVSIQSPQNISYANTNITLNATWNGNITSCRYVLNNVSNNLSCGVNTSFIANVGQNSLYINVSNSTGSNLSRTVYFTVNSSGNITVTINFPANTTYYGSLSIVLEHTVTGGTPSACWYRLNNNATNATLPNCGNVSITYGEGVNNITVYANSSNGTIFSSATRYFTDGGLLVAISSPSNTTYSTANISLNFSVTDNAGSACWYRLNSSANVTIASCANTTFTASQGANNITAYANRTTGAIFNSSTVSFTFDNAPPNVTFVSPTPSNGTTTNLNHTYINVTIDEAPDFIRLEFGGTNYTMTNITAARLAWFRNMTGLSNGNYTYKVYANDTLGSMNVSAPRTVGINATS